MSKKSNPSESKNQTLKKKEVVSVIEKAGEKSIKSNNEMLNKPKKVMINKQQTMMIGGIIVLGLLVAAGYMLKGQMVVAMVNGQPITRMAYVGEMEKQVGETTMNNMVLEMLIQQESEKIGVTVEQSVVDEELKKLEERMKEQGQELDKLLEAEGMTRLDLIKQIRFQKLVEKMAPKSSEITDEQVLKYVEENKAMFSEDMKEEEVKEMAKQQLESQDSRSSMNNWLEMLKEQANIQYWNK